MKINPIKYEKNILEIKRCVTSWTRKIKMERQIVFFFRAKGTKIKNSIFEKN
jgi:hypothetical protein